MLIVGTYNVIKSNKKCEMKNGVKIVSLIANHPHNDSTIAFLRKVALQKKKCACEFRKFLQFVLV